MRVSALRRAVSLVVILAPLAIQGCASDEHAAPAPTPTAPSASPAVPAATPAATPSAAPAPAAVPAAMHAVAHVEPTQGNSARGIVRFEQVADGVRVTAVIDGLTANGVHAIHLHECGDCSSPDAMSAGGHYNPDGNPHGSPDSPKHHAGDFGNLNADASGRASLDFVAKGITVGGPVNPILGLSVILHAKADDFVTQPTGNAGARIGCGVIGATKPVTPK
jgi:Cu-Zn family superoxide dismutase